MKAFNKIMLSLLTVSVIVMIVGYVQLTNSVVWGKDKVSDYLRENMQGSMNTDEYNLMWQNFIEQYRWSGSILLCLGGIAIITCTFVLLINNRSRLS